MFWVILLLAVSVGGVRAADVAVEEVVGDPAEAGPEVERMSMFGKSATRRLVVSRPAGLHARPCLAIATTVQQSQSTVELRTGEQRANAGSVLELMSLGAGEGTQVLFVAKGPDAEQVLDALEKLFASNFGLNGEDEP